MFTLRRSVCPAVAAVSAMVQAPGAVAVHSVDAAPESAKLPHPAGLAEGGRRGRDGRVDLHRRSPRSRNGDRRLPERSARGVERVDPDRMRAGPEGDRAVPLARESAAPQRSCRRRLDRGGNARDTRVRGRDPHRHLHQGPGVGWWRRGPAPGQQTQQHQPGAVRSIARAAGPLGFRSAAVFAPHPSDLHPRLRSRRRYCQHPPTGSNAHWSDTRPHVDWQASAS